MNLNTPVWGNKVTQSLGAFMEAWCLRLTEPSAQRALWIRLDLMNSSNGFRRLAETWAVYYERNPGGDTTKIAVKQSHDIMAFHQTGISDFKISDCQFNENGTRGSIHAKGHSITWDLSMAPRQEVRVNLIPKPLQRAGIVRDVLVTPYADLRITGTSQIDGKNITWNESSGMQSHQVGTKNGYAWTWAHCNVFVDELGKPIPLVFEGISAKASWLGPISSPRLSSLYFLYRGKPYSFNSIRDFLRLKSRTGINSWMFEAERGEVSFRGEIRAEHKDFAGLTLEDTNGSLLYYANSELSEMKVHVYRRGKLEGAYRAPGTASFEVASRRKNPYVPLMI